MLMLYRRALDKCYQFCHCKLNISSLPSSHCALYRDVKDALYQAPGIADRCLLIGMLVQQSSLHMSDSVCTGYSVINWRLIFGQ